MNRRLIATAVCGAAILTAATTLAPAAIAAPKKPGLYGPSKVTVGQEVTYTSVFKAAPKKDGCFTPTFTFSDDLDSGGWTVWMCLSDSTGPTPKPQPKIETDTQTHVFTEPGTYTVTVQSGGVPNGGGIASPNGAVVKGPRSYTMTVYVIPAQ